MRRGVQEIEQEGRSRKTGKRSWRRGHETYPMSETFSLLACQPKSAELTRDDKKKITNQSPNVSDSNTNKRQGEKSLHIFSHHSQTYINFTVMKVRYIAQIKSVCLIICSSCLFV